MKKSEKDKLINFTLINVVAGVALVIILYLIVDKFTNIGNNTAKDFVFNLGIVFTLISVFTAIFAYIRKKLNIVKYCTIPFIAGISMLLLHYAFFESTFGIPNFGFYVFYSLLTLTALYIAGLIGYTILCCKKRY